MAKSEEEMLKEAESHGSFDSQIIGVDVDDLLRVLKENRHLRAQVDALQGRMSEMVLERQRSKS